MGKLGNVPEPTTRDRMVSTALTLFRREGYPATSWRRLVEAAGTPWGSAYHHFPGGKEELGVAAVELGAEVVAATIRRAFDRSDSAEDAVHWWFEKAGQALADDDYRGGCPLATIVLEMAHGSPLLTAACREAFVTWHELIADRLQDRGCDAGRADDMATAVINNLEGALLLSRIHRSTQPMTRAAGHLEILLRAQ
jgi:TetR/AcrR family transcriptional repressor of lmrAB and yxaGH operons